MAPLSTTPGHIIVITAPLVLTRQFNRTDPDSVHKDNYLKGPLIDDELFWQRRRTFWRGRHWETPSTLSPLELQPRSGLPAEVKITRTRRTNDYLVACQISRLAQIDRQSQLSELIIADLREIPPRPYEYVKVDSLEIDARSEFWTAVSDSSPERLLGFVDLTEEEPALAAQCLIGRYPERDTGLSALERTLLSELSSDEYSLATRVMAHVITGRKSEHWVADREVFNKLLALDQFSLQAPLVLVQGDRRSPRFCSCKLSPTGSRVLNGELNHVELNGIDRWVGGVHLTQKNIWYRTEDWNLIQK